jgi:hypothetical protein
MTTPQAETTRKAYGPSIDDIREHPMIAMYSGTRIDPLDETKMVAMNHYQSETDWSRHNWFGGSWTIFVEASGGSGATNGARVTVENILNGHDDVYVSARRAQNRIIPWMFMDLPPAHVYCKGNLYRKRMHSSFVPQ